MTEPTPTLAQWIEIANQQTALVLGSIRFETPSEEKIEPERIQDIERGEKPLRLNHNETLTQIERNLSLLQTDLGVPVTMSSFPFAEIDDTPIYPDWMIRPDDPGYGFNPQTLATMQSILATSPIPDFDQLVQERKETFIKLYVDTFMGIMFGATKVNLCDNWLVKAGYAILWVIAWIGTEITKGVEFFLASLVATGQLLFPDDQTIKRLLGEYFQRFYCDFRNSRDVQVTILPSLREVYGLPKPPALPPKTDNEIANSIKDEPSGVTMRQILEAVLAVRDYAKEALNETIINEAGNEGERWGDVFRQEVYLQRIASNISKKLVGLVSDGNVVSAILPDFTEAIENVSSESGTFSSRSASETLREGETETASTQSIDELLSPRLRQVVNLPPIQPLPPVEQADIVASDTSTGREVLEGLSRIQSTTLPSIGNNVKVMGSANRSYYNAVRDAQRETEAVINEVTQLLGSLEARVRQLERAARQSNR